MMKTLALTLSLLLLGISNESCADDEHKVLLPDNGDKSVINVGVIVDVESWVGKVVQNCTRMAVSDFYDLNRGYKTRIVLHVRDSKGDSLHGIAAALELLENDEVHAFIIPQVPNEELFLTKLGNKVNVPLLSFSSIASSNKYPYFIQVSHDDNNQFHGIAAFVQAFRWKSFVFLYEDTADARQDQTYINDILQENHSDVGYQTAISLNSTDDQIINELNKLVMMKASIILVHLSSALASQVQRNAKMLGLMSKGYAWIMTSKTMNLLGVQDSSVYESMQGVLGYNYHKFLYEYVPFYDQIGSYNDLVYQVYLQKFDARDPLFFLKPLKAELWIISGCFFFLTGFIVWLIEHRINEEFQGPAGRQVGTALWFAFSTIVYAHRERLQSNLSRFVVGVWLFVVLILTSIYTAKLSSLLTVEQIKLTKGVRVRRSFRRVNETEYQQNIILGLKIQKQLTYSVFKKHKVFGRLH